MYSKKGNNRFLAMGLAMLAGVVVGGFVGEILTNVAKDVASLSWLRFLGYGHSFGFSPVRVDLIAITVQFGVELKFSICGVLFMLLAIFICRRMG